MNPSITTPAADAAKSIQALIADEAQYLCVVVAKATLSTLLTERSALIAERDALKAEVAKLMRAQAASVEPVLYASPKQLSAAIAGTLSGFENLKPEFGGYLPVRTEQGGLFTSPLYTSTPPSQASVPGEVGALLKSRVAELEQSLSEVLAFQSAAHSPSIHDYGRWRRAYEASPLRQHPTPPAQAANGAFTKALEIRTAQGWKLTGEAIPVLYTDTINDQQVMRDDVWLCTTAALKPAQAAADARDADRYRKWRHDFTEDEASEMMMSLSDAWTPDQVDSLIDAALATHQQGGKHG